MSFTPFTFKYTPPATVATQVNSTTQPAVATTGSQASVSVNPVATNYASNLSDLSDTAQFIQSIILDKYKNVGVTIDPEVDPDTAQALNGCYGQVPPIVTTAMLSNLVDASNSLSSISVASAGTSVQADPAAQSNVSQIVNTVTDHLIESNRAQDYQLLAGMALKTDALIFQSIAANLSIYPAAVTPSQDVQDLLNSISSAYSSIYATLYQSLTTANIINQDITNVLTLASQAVQDIVRLVSTFNFLQGFIMKDKGKSVIKTLEGGAAALFCAEASSALFSIDNIAQRAISPLKGTTGILGSIVSSVQKSITEVESAGKIINPLRDSTLSGMSSTSPCAKAVLSTYPGVNLTPDTNTLSNGLKLIGHYIDSAQRKINTKFTLMNESLAKATLGRAKAYTDLLELTCSLSNIESSISLFNQVIEGKNTGTLAATTSTAAQLQTFTNSLSISSTNTSSAVIPANVLSVLKTGGYSI